jgi:hypothetical protein
VKRHLRRDAPIHGFIAAYALAALLLATYAGLAHKFAPLMYVGVIAGPGMVLGVGIGAGLWSLGSPSPFAALRGALRHLRQPPVLSGLLLFASVSLFVGVFVSVKTMLPDLVPFYADPLLADIDRVLHGGAPWRYAVAIVPPGVTPAIEALYFGGWNLLLPGCMLAVAVVPSLRDVRAQYVWTFLIAWALLGNVLAGAFMSAGPVYYQHATGSARFAELVAYLAQHSAAQEWQALLWRSHVEGNGFGSGISAFPSMHLANATMFVLLAARIGRRWMWAAIAYCAFILFGSVYLGWHYAIDGYFSIAAVLVIWKAVGWVIARRRTP